MSIVNQVSQLYIGILGRAADRAGLEYWVQQVQTGKLTIEGVAKSFQEQPEWINGNGQLDRAGILNELYKNLFGREATGVDKAYWVLGEGASVPLEKLVLALIAPGAALGNDALVLAARTDAAVNFSFSDADTTDLDAAAAAITGVASGSTFTLTTGVDNRTGTVGDDVFEAPLGRAGELPVTEQTLQSFDTLDGGEGYDVLNAQLSGFAGLLDPQNPTITNIEQYNLTVAADGGYGGLDLSRADGYEVLQNLNSRGYLDLYNVNVDAEGAAPTIALTNVRDDTGVDYDASVSVVDVQNVVASQVGSATNSVNLRVDVIATSAGINTLNLDVSNGVYLNLSRDAQRVENLNITGADTLALTTSSNFQNLVNLDSSEYEGDLTLDISGSGTLENVLTGNGDDTITAAAANFSADTTPPATTVDLGEGNNRLILEDSFETQPDGTYTGGGIIDSAELSALDFTLGPVSGVQTLELVDVELDGGASLALDGVGGLETLVFRDFDADGNDLSINGAPEVLTINATSSGDLNDADFDMEGGLFSINGAVNLTMNAGDDLDINGGLRGDVLETLVLNAGDDVTLIDNAAQGLDALTSIEVNALDTSTGTGGSSNATVDLTLAGFLGDDSELSALTTVNVAAVDNATLTLTGREGSAAVAGVRQVEQFVVSVGSGGTQAGDIIFTSGDIPGGVIVTDYSAGTPLTNRSNFAAQDVAQDLDASAALNASVPTGLFGVPTGNTVTVEWADFGVKEQLSVLSAVATSGSISSPTPGSTTLVTEGVTPEDMVEGEGFEALEVVTVVAENGNADVELTDVYGAFTLDVAAGSNAWIDLDNTEVTTVTVVAGDHVDIDVEGNTVGNGSLTSITVESDSAWITLEDNVSSFELLDVSNVATSLTVDVSAADYDLGGTESVQYLIGATDSVTFVSNIDATEWFSFVGGDIGTVTIGNFVTTNPTTHDIIDVSDLGISQITQVNIDDNGFGDAVITSALFDGSITLTGVAAADVDAGNFFFA